MASTIPSGSRLLLNPLNLSPLFCFFSFLPFSCSSFLFSPGLTLVLDSFFFLSNSSIRSLQSRLSLGSHVLSSSPFPRHFSKYSAFSIDNVIIKLLCLIKLMFYLSTAPYSLVQEAGLVVTSEAGPPCPLSPASTRRGRRQSSTRLVLTSKCSRPCRQTSTT